MRSRPAFPLVLRSLAALAMAALPAAAAYAACTAPNPLANVGESTPSVDFTDNGDGTVTHGKTGLMWKRCSEGQSWNGTTCAGVASTLTWSAALTVAVAASTGGKHDWRVPNIKELDSIVETCGYGPSINASIFPQTPTTVDFWSRTTYAPIPSQAWDVKFYDGTDYTDVKTTTGGYVRLVRAPSAPDNFDAQPPPTFTVTPSAGANGSISPNTVQTVGSGATVAFALAASAGYHSVIGVEASACGGTLNPAGTSYTTNPVTQNCTVSATFVQTTYTVTPSAGANGSISPNTVQTVGSGATVAFALAPSAGYHSVIGVEATACGGTLNPAGTSYTTNPVTKSCTVMASFSLTAVAHIQVSGSGHPIPPGASAPNLVDGTDFGSVPVGTSVVHNFTIFNSSGTVVAPTGRATFAALAAAGDLTIIAITSSNPLFTVNGGVGVLAQGASASFGVVYHANTGGTQNGLITITSDDPATPVYTFSVTATAIAVSASPAVPAPMLTPWSLTILIGVMGWLGWRRSARGSAVAEISGNR